MIDDVTDEREPDNDAVPETNANDDIRRGFMGGLLDSDAFKILTNDTSHLWANDTAIAAIQSPLPSAAHLTATNTETMAESVVELVGLTAANLSLAKEQRAQADRSQRFSQRMTWASLIISIASLAAAVVAVVVSVAG